MRWSHRGVAIIIFDALFQIETYLPPPQRVVSCFSSDSAAHPRRSFSIGATHRSAWVAEYLPKWLKPL